MEWLRLAGVICLAAFPQAVNATAEHSYRPGEYDLIDHGLSPNKEYAIMAHGDSEGNPENLRLYLFDAPNHHRIGPLEEVHDAGRPRPSTPNGQPTRVMWRSRIELTGTSTRW
jgi:hypothetical protein